MKVGDKRPVAVAIERSEIGRGGNMACTKLGTDFPYLSLRNRQACNRHLRRVEPCIVIESIEVPCRSSDDRREQYVWLLFSHLFQDSLQLRRRRLHRHIKFAGDFSAVSDDETAHYPIGSARIDVVR